MEVTVGLRVVRGPDWRWGDQDGGEGCLGTVVEVEGERAVVVWDVGYLSSYRCGAEGKYELLVYDSGPSGITHPNVVCGACHQHNIMGMRWKCALCPDFDLCTPCYHHGEHSLEHTFSRINGSEDDGRVTLPPRASSKKIPISGFFPEAKVVPGENWCWHDQADGKSGFVTNLTGYSSESARSVVEVVWKNSQKKNIYRAGHKGKVDLKCIKTGQGGSFYPEHLPKLGASSKDKQQTPSAVPSSATPTALAVPSVPSVPQPPATVVRTATAPSVVQTSTTALTTSTLTDAPDSVSTPVKPTSPIPSGASILRGGASVVPSGASFFPSGASFFPGGASVLPDGASVVPGGASFFPGGASVVPGGASVLPDGASVVPGGASVLPGGASVLPDGASFFPGGASVVPTPTAKTVAPSSVSPPLVTDLLAGLTSNPAKGFTASTSPAKPAVTPPAKPVVTLPAKTAVTPPAKPVTPPAKPDNTLPPNNATVTGNSASPSRSSFVTGDHVRVMLDLEIFKMMQEGHGGWNDQMNEALTEVGTVQSVLDSGDIRVRYPNNLVWTMNSEAVVKVKQFSKGDVVRILDDLAKVHSLQENHGGWLDDMALSLGQVGRVATVFPTGDVRVGVNGMMWTFNPACLIPAPEEYAPELPTELPGVEGFGGDLEQLQMKLLSLLGQTSAVMVAAAASGDEATVRQHLSKNPQDVNGKAGGKTALHCAIAGGHLTIVKNILEFNPDLEMGDEDGDTPIHVCAWTDEDESAKLLIDRGAKVNATNDKGATPLIIAAIKGHQSVLRILANHPQIKLHEQDSNGNTALHGAVMAQKNESVSVLLDAGADPTLLNFRLYTPIHEAALNGFLPALEQFVRKKPDYVNLRKDDGFTAIHLASLNDHLDVVTALADMDFCNINELTEMGQTALHLAVNQGHARIVERLVGYGIELNTQDSDGDTALHMALSKQIPDGLSAETPQLKKVHDSLTFSEDMSQRGNVTIACFLVQEGASTSIANNQGATPLAVCLPEVATMVMTFIGSLSSQISKKFHGSLRALPETSTVTASPTASVVIADKPQTSLSTDGPTPPSASSAVTVTSNVEECFLCEDPVEVRFEPCGHAILCSGCAERAKKCIKCKAAVKSVIKLKVTCPMCNEEEATVTMRPCGHQFCPACAKRMKRCFDCREEITDKEGLTKDLPSVSPGGPDSPNCAICLTEPKNTVLICGHQLCWDCAQKVDNCPVCRKFVTHRIRIFQ